MRIRKGKNWIKAELKHDQLIGDESMRIDYQREPGFCVLPYVALECDLRYLTPADARRLFRAALELLAD